MGLPRGEIVLVFTDIEGSTKLFHELGARYGEVLDEHRRCIASVVDGLGGTIVRTEGDSFFLAFEDAQAAVTACLRAQQELRTANWPHGRPVRVRMGLHRGSVEVIGDDDYIGLAVHEAARVTDAAHGGQVLLTDTVAAAIDWQPLGGAWLEDLGLHRLRDFPEPRRLLQLCHDDLEHVGPARLRTKPAAGGRLPAPATELVGRQDELSRLASLLVGPTRLVTVLGPGGAGKTRLALEVAWSLRSRFPGGTWFVDLAPVTDSAAVLDAVHRALGSPSGPTQVDAIADALGAEPSLLVLDNFEHLLDGAIHVAELLEASAMVTILATSRERLHLRADHEFGLVGLPLDDAVALLDSRADAAGVTTDLADADRTALCERLDGLPLAIELAAARLRALGPRQLLAELDASIAVLSGGAVDLPGRHRALAATIAWSVDRLDSDERRFLLALAITSGRFDLDAASAIATGVGLSGALSLLEALLDRSLLQPTDGKPDRPRFLLLETIRAYAVDALEADASLRSAALDAHVLHFAELLATAEPMLRGRDQVEWLGVLDLDHDNLMLALDRADQERALQMTADLQNYWLARGHWSEARTVLARVLDTDVGDDLRRAKLRAVAAKFAERQGDLGAADADATAALATAIELGDVGLEGRVRNTLGDVASARGDRDEALRCYTQALDAALAADDEHAIAVGHSNLGLLAWRAQDIEEARNHFDEALILSRRMGDQRSVAILTGDLGLIARADGNLDEAELRFETSLQLARELEDPVAIADAYLNLGTVAKDRGDERLARDRYFEALSLYEHLNHRAFMARTFLHLALATDELDRAREWVLAAKHIAIEVGDTSIQSDAAQLEQALAEVERELSSAE